VLSVDSVVNPTAAIPSWKGWRRFSERGFDRINRIDRIGPDPSENIL